MDYQILIHAGGEGTRLQEFSKGLPKALVDVKGKPLILYAMEPFLREGHRAFVMTTSHRAELVQDYFRKSELNVNFVFEKTLAGRAGAIRLGIEQGQLDPNKPVIIAHCDDIIDIDIKQLIREHEASGCQATLVLSKSFVNPFGLAEVERNKITGFVEKPDYPTLPSQGVNTGMSVFSNLKLFQNAVIPSHPEYAIYPGLARQGQINAFFVAGWHPVNSKDEYMRFVKFLEGK
jgi:NDP-sugar pyrophosphorylase family protein